MSQTASAVASPRALILQAEHLLEVALVGRFGVTREPVLTFAQRALASSPLRTLAAGVRTRARR
jgi:hypothetical protein